MYVKALRLAGFKSFATPTILEFERGVNVIVGPNGSGKSNISDALQWVLGSQAPSTLRGGSMEDVIFAGSATRARLAIAEVELTLDNADRILPLDLAEVTIARSTDRSGASEYRINGAPCRLLDITELLSDTGVGRSIHTVVGQGQLDAVLQARPEDRRAFIEEAAQIGKFRRRKERAVRKIERVDDDLTRLNDVLLELRRAIRPLKRQVSAASMYSELMAEHRDLRQRLVATELARLEGDPSEADLATEARRADLLAEELASVRARLDGADATSRELAARSERASEVAHRMTRATDRLGSLGKLAVERAERLAARLSAETEEGYRERIRLLQGERDSWSRTTADLAERKTSTEELAATARAESASADAALRDVEALLGVARQRETLGSQALVRAEGSEAAEKATQGATEARVHSILERRHIAEDELAAAVKSVTAAEADVRALERELDGATAVAAESETRLEAARERAEELRVQLNAVQVERSAVMARVRTLEEVERLFADLAEAGPRLAPLLEEARARARTATATQGDVDALVASAEAAIEREWQDVARRDEEIRRLDALAAGAGERLTGSRRRRETAEVAIAALDEELARTRDALAVAERAVAEARALVPEKLRELEEARSERESLEAQTTAARRVAGERADLATRAEAEVRAVHESLVAAETRARDAERGIAEAEAALEGLEQRRAELDRARTRAEHVASVAGRAAGWGTRWSVEADERARAAHDGAVRAERDLAGLRDRERELAGELEGVGRRRNAAEVRRAEIRARTEALGSRAMDEWAMTLDDLRGIELIDESEEDAARARVEKLDRDMRRMGAVNPRAADEYRELAERETFLQEQIDDLRSSRRDLMKIVHEVDETIVQVFGEAFEDVARQFESVFDRLFPGGTGRLRLTAPDDLLATGIEIEARPPGKNVKKLSLLSGGERSLVALAFLFAIFRSRPSPFYLLDEVEAALDDVNLSRFLRLIEELEEHAQVMIVTHQKRTMEVGDVLYGVSMAKDGVSQVVAKRMDQISV